MPPGWINVATGKFTVATLDGQKVLQKAPDNTLFKRMRMFIGLDRLVELHGRGRRPRRHARRQQGDIGLTAQRYSLVLYGTSQRLKIEPWEPETTRTVTLPFAWKPDTWYRLKLRVENLPNGGSARGARPGRRARRSRPQWMIEKTDPIGNRQGAPGLFIDAEFGAHVDNLKITAESSNRIEAVGVTIRGR